MWESFREYLPAVGRRWWAVVGFFDTLAIVSGAFGITLLIVWWGWLIVGTVGFMVAQFLVYDKVRKERDEGRHEVAAAISELESDTIEIGGRPISMAALLWKTRDSFLRGMQVGVLPGDIYTGFEQGSRDEVSEAWGSLIYRLRLLQLIEDRQRQHGTKGYMEITTTSLGISVLRELEKRWRVKCR